MTVANGEERQRAHLDAASLLVGAVAAGLVERQAGAGHRHADAVARGEHLLATQHNWR